MGVTGGAEAGDAGGMRGVALSKVPTAAWVCLTVGFLGVVAALVVLGVTGTPADELWTLLSRVANLAGVVFGGGSLVYAGAAARNAQEAAEQTNGSLDARIAAGVARALAAQRADDVAQGGEFRRG